MAETRQETLTRLFPKEIDGGVRPEEPIPTDWPFNLSFPQLIANDDNWFEQENAFLRQLLSNDKVANALIEGIKEQLANCDLRLVTESLKGLMSPEMYNKLKNLSNYAHPRSGVTAGTYRSVAVNAEGHVTGGSNPTTLSGYGITDAAPKSHGNHVPALETANNSRFLRNDGTFQAVTPGNIGAYTKSEIDGKVTTINNAINGKEPKFNKNNAFNKNFGTAAGTVCQGNDARLANARPANGGNSDTVDGLHAHGGRNNEANKLVRTDGNGYVQITHINSDQPVNNGNVANVIYDNGDGYFRKCGLSHLINKINAGGGGGIVAASLGQNGYVKFSNGLILQWGRQKIADNISFPLSFQIGCFYVKTSILNPATSYAADYDMQVVSMSKINVTLVLQAYTNNTATYQDSFMWFALGA